MSLLSQSFNFVRIASLAGILVTALPMASLGQGRGREKREDKREEKFDKKCAKFVNCHDARDGRVDGRGPDRTRFSDRRDRFDDHFDRRRFSDRRDRFDDSFNRRRFRNRDSNDYFRRLQERRIRNFRNYSRRDYRSYNQYNNQYETPYDSQSGSSWTDLLNLFRQ